MKGQIPQIAWTKCPSYFIEKENLDRIDIKIAKSIAKHKKV